MSSVLEFNFLDAASFDFTCLLHTYFSLPDVSKTTISGLGALKYIDKVMTNVPASTYVTFSAQ